MRGLCSLGCAVALVIAGCSESHGLYEDAGRSDAFTVGDADGCGASPPIASCAYESGHVCGDVSASPICEGGAWVCPPGTRPDFECWCYGNAVRDPSCTCQPGGWVCPPAECPADPSTAEGTPCATEGQSCGSCSDPCGWCNLLQCSGHVWTRLEAPPPEPGTCESFACGPEVLCVRHEQYCDHVLSDIGGEPDSFVCRAFPSACSARDCECFLGSGPSCSDDGAGAVELTSGGG
jgi:hypothetical protein